MYKIQPGSPDEVKYSVFRRINTGGLVLNNQEIRNAMAKPVDRNLLKDLTELESTKAMLGDLSKRMRDQELVLRFWAFYRFDYLEDSHKSELASFLDKAMEEIKKGDDAYKTELRNKFIVAIDRCYGLLGKEGFSRNPKESARFKSASLFEVWMVSMANLSEKEYSGLCRKKSAFEENVTSLLHDQEFINSIAFSTHKKDHVKTRYSKVRNLISEILND